MVDETFQFNGTPGLCISDGSVMPRLTPGPSSKSIMQSGMRVVDAVAAAFDEPKEYKRTSSICLVSGLLLPCPFLT